MLAWTLFVVALMHVDFAMSHATHSGTKESQDRLTSSLNDALLSYLCRGKNGIPCSGHGQCSGGMCACDRGYSGMKCDINSADMPSVISPADLSPADLPSILPGELPPALPAEMPPLALPGDLRPVLPLEPPAGSGNGGLSGLMSTRFPFDPVIDRQRTSSTASTVASAPVYCTVHDESICSGRGLCQGGRCVCDQGYSGTICELSSDVGFCNTYKECAECTAFMLPCPDKCSKMASFYLVYGFPDSGSPIWTCRFKSSRFQCHYYFQREYEDPTGYKSIQVIPCMDYRDVTDNVTTEEPFTTTVMTSSTSSTTRSTTEVKTRAPPTQTTTKRDDNDDSISDRKMGKADSGSSNVSVNSALLLVSFWLLAR